MHRSPRRFHAIGATVIASCLSLLTLSPAIRAQSALGTLSGRATGQNGEAEPGAIVHVVGTSVGAMVDSSGAYVIRRLPIGRYLIRVTKLGFAPDTATVVVASGAPARFDARLHPAAEVLGNIVVNAQRMGESRASAFEQRAAAPNMVNVLSGDDIRALPTLNAAEAAGRIPGVTTERDEGEGKFVQIRGTEPRLTNVTIDGAHVPGTERGARVPKLDDVPSDVLGAIEVSKTLTAEMDADAIGGSVNLVTKTPEGRPHGYVSGQFGQMQLHDADQYQGGFAYGGRFGTDGKLGFLIGGSADHNNRGINDVEPAWGVDAQGRSFPVEWSQRDYVYHRNRYGLAGDVDYRFSDVTSLALRGLWSRFENLGTSYTYDIATAATGSTYGDTGDSAAVGTRGYGTGVELTRQISDRTPREQMYGGTASFKTMLGQLATNASFNYAGTRQTSHDYSFSPFVYDGPSGQGLTLAYDASSTRYPTYSFATPAMASAAANPANYSMDSWRTNDGSTIAHDGGGSVDLSLPYLAGATSSTLRFGAKVRDEARTYVNTSGTFRITTPVDLTQVLGGFSDPGFYHDLSSAYTIGPMPSLSATSAYEASHPFKNVTNTARDALGSFDGSERIVAGYVSNTADIGPLQLYLGLRAEQTHSSYTGHVVAKDTAGSVSVSTVPGSQTYTDLFPSVQLRFDVASGTQLRAAVTRGIARPNYSDLAPHLQGTPGIDRADPSNLSTGNPDLRPQHAWNYDLMLEHFFPSVGVLSGSAFYKSISDFIFNRTFTYQGPITEFAGQVGTRPENGGSGHLLGEEIEWAERLTFLPGVLDGFGYDVNYTHVDSRALVDPSSNRYAPLARQSPNLANAQLTYDRGPISGRLAWSYQGANISDYGDGSATAAGDVYFYAHSQVDASLSYLFTHSVQIQLQALNLNNAPFGFFTGTPGHDFSIQREYYGPTLYLGAKYSL